VTPDATVRVAVTDAVVVDVEGADRLSYLEDVSSQHLVDAAVGTTSALLVLDPHGAALAVADVVIEDGRCRLLAPHAAVAEHLVGVLGARTFLADARFVTSGDRVVALRGSQDEVARLVADHVPNDAARVVRDDGADVVLDPADAARLVGALVAAGAVAADPADLEDARVRAGRPAWGREIAGPHLPEELGLLPTHVHLAKGCYPGQEAVARMWMLGRPRRRLARLRVDGDGALAAGAADGEGRARIEVTSVTRDGRDALAFVGADTAPGDRLTVAGVGVEVVGLVGDGLEVPGHDPRMRRRRDAAAPGRDGSEGAGPPRRLPGGPPSA